MPDCHLVGVDPAPEALGNPELELHPLLVTRLAHWDKRRVNRCEVVREQKSDQIRRVTRFVVTISQVISQCV